MGAVQERNQTGLDVRMTSLDHLSLASLMPKEQVRCCLVREQLKATDAPLK